MAFLFPIFPRHLICEQDPGYAVISQNGSSRVSHLGSVTEGPSPTKTRFITESLNRLSLLRGIELIPNGTTIITMKRITAKKYIVTEGSTSTSKGLILDTRVGKLFSRLVLKHSPLLLGSYMHAHFQHTLPEVSSSPCHSLRRLLFSMLQGQSGHTSWRRDSGLYMGERNGLVGGAEQANRSTRKTGM